MKRIKRISQAGLMVLLLMAGAAPAAAQDFWGFKPPEGWLPPPLNPTGAKLVTKEISPGVYALLSTKLGVDNSGFVVGERGVLVIDAHVNGAMARQIQAAVRKVTAKPIVYLVNTNFHGDHTFGNYAFPPETVIIAHRKTAERMRDFEHEKKLLLQTVDNDATVFADVKLRLPDVVFDDYLRIDLGGRIVELHHFGHGNTPGDTVVYAPAAKAAWTGNLVLGEGTFPWLIEGRAGAYLNTIARFSGTLDVETIVPGHGVMTSGAILSRYLRYLGELIHSVQKAAGAGHTVEETLARTSLGEKYLVPADSPLAPLRPLMAGFHRWNVKRVYLELNGR
ncbi:MAG: MBL fold metallo-hydrolase [Nitrospinota bacterium]